MKDLDEMLKQLSKEEAKLDQTELSQMEKKRIYRMTMKKIEEEKTSLKRRKIKNGVTKVAAAAVIIAALGTTGTKVGAMLGLDNNIKHFFGIKDSKQNQAESMVTTPDAKSSDHGVTLNISQAIGDGSRFYVVFTAKNLPKTTKELGFKERKLQVGGKNGYDYTMDGPKKADVKGKTVKYTMLVSGINRNGESVNINGKTVQLKLNDLGYRNQKGKFVTVTKGTWKLKWKFTTKAETKKMIVNKKIKVMDSKCLWKDIEITPLSLTVHSYVTKQGREHFSETEWQKYEKSQRVTVTFTDGSKIDSRFLDDVNESWGDKKHLGFKTVGFKNMVGIKDVASVTYGNQTVKLQKIKNNVKREKRVCKAMKCYITLPKDLSSITKMQVKKNVWNKDIKKKETYAMFTAKKHGVKMTIFAIHRIKGVIPEDEMQKKMPTMDYIGYYGGYTYGMEYGEIQNKDQKREFADILNKDMKNLKYYFEYVR